MLRFEKPVFAERGFQWENIKKEAQQTKVTASILDIFFKYILKKLSNKPETLTENNQDCYNLDAHNHIWNNITQLYKKEGFMNWND